MVGLGRHHTGSSKHNFLKVIILICVLIVASRIGMSLFDTNKNNVDAKGIVTHAQDVNLTHVHAHDNDSQLQAKTTICSGITSALNISSWPPVIYHKILEGKGFNDTNHDQLPLDDRQALDTIDQFNRLRPYILSKQLLDVGFTLGTDGYRISKFANRLLESINDAEKPLTIAITGHSFTIGSNCGESRSQDKKCAWPYRLSDRVLGSPFPAVRWKMLQTNAQNSINVAHLIPMLLDEFTNTTTTLDAIILDNAITDRLLGTIWYEALVRTLLQNFPQTLIVSLVDAISGTVGTRKENGVTDFTTKLHAVQDHYGLTVVDMTTMVRHLFNKTDQILLENVNVVQQLLKEYQNITHGNVQVDQLDLLWPQSSHMVSSNGTSLDDFGAQDEFNKGAPVYWANYLPIVQKTKPAYYPANHPPWPTHQYVADSVMHALLRVTRAGLGCDNDEPTLGNIESSPQLINETVADKAQVDACFICLSPLTKIDAKTTQHISNLTSSAATTSNEEGVVVTCGDWKWITDERNRSGWQSDQAGSIIRFRLKIGNKPTISLNYMKSWQRFGNLRLIFLPVMRGASSSTPPLLRCGDVISGNQKDEDNGIMPSIILDGKAAEFSLWEAIVFPNQHARYDLNTARYWAYMNRTVLGLGSKDVEYVDVYVMNPNNDTDRRRIKIQSVQSC